MFKSSRLKRRCLELGLLLAAFSGLAARPAHATRYESANVPLPVPPSGTGGSGDPAKDTTVSMLAVPDTGTVSNVRVSLYLPHTADGDLVITLTSPNGTVVTLSNRHGGSGDNFGTGTAEGGPSNARTIFADRADNQTITGMAPFVGLLSPEPGQNLSSFNGGPTQGFWTLSVTDADINDTGTLQAWALSLNDAPVATQSGPSFSVTTLDDHDDGFCTASDCSLHEAIGTANVFNARNANAGATVAFAPAVRGTISLQSALPTLASSITLQGPGANLLSVSGNKATGFFVENLGVTLANSTSTVSGLTFANGKGGGMASVDSVMVNDGTQNSTLNVLNCAFIGNASAVGGAILNYGGGNTTPSSGTLNLSNCTFSGNSASSSGGAIYNYGGTGTATVTASNCTFSGNSARTGGAFTNLGSNPTSSSTAILNLNSCTLSGNSVTNTASGSINNSANSTGTATLNITNTTAQGAGLETDGNGFPILKDNGGPTFTVALLAGSPTINAADPGIQSGTDQRRAGFARVVGGRADIGAYEVQASPSVQKSAAKPSASSS